MRKYIAIVMMICLSASLLTGCGGSGGGGRSMGGQPKSETRTDAAQADGYVIFVKDANTEEPLAILLGYAVHDGQDRQHRGGCI